MRLNARIYIRDHALQGKNVRIWINIQVMVVFYA